MAFTRDIIEEIGLEPERLKMINLSSAMGKKFAEEADQITEEIRELGPSPLRRSLSEENVSTAA